MNELDRWFDGRPPVRTAEALHRLLAAEQDRVYNLCYQVLRHREDAEDAAQKALLGIAQGIGSLKDALHFRRWACRVALHAALKIRRSRLLARRTEESMEIPDPRPAEGPGDALSEALALLDDDSRELIVGHYYERRTLEELGAEAGLSAVAIWKRLTRARSQLRERLATLGLGAMTAGPEQVLESITPVPAPGPLLSSAQVAAVFGRGHSLMLKGAAAMVINRILIAVVAIIGLAIGGIATATWKGGEVEALRAPAEIARPAAAAPAPCSHEEDLASLRARIRELEREAEAAKRQAKEQAENAKRGLELLEEVIERNHEAAVRTVITIPTAQADFRSNDRDGNGQNDFWAADLSGLYRLVVCDQFSGRTGPIRLIEPETAAADAAPLEWGTLADLPCERKARNGYWFKALAPEGSVDGRNPACFALSAYPEKYGVSGRYTFLLTEDCRPWRKDLKGADLSAIPADPESEGWELVK